MQKFLHNIAMRPKRSAPERQAAFGIQELSQIGF